MLHVGRSGKENFIPLNIDPTAPSFEKMLVPVPEVFSPAAGYVPPSISPSFDARGRFRATYSLLD